MIVAVILLVLAVVAVAAVWHRALFGTPANLYESSKFERGWLKFLDKVSPVK